MAELTPKKVVLSQIVEDLNSGLTRWKKDDIGFGSLEKKYSLQMNEMIELLAHPKLKNVETKIPTFIIVDDIEDIAEEVPQVKVEQEEQQQNTTVEVAKPIVTQPSFQTRTTVVVKEEPKRKLEAFI